MFVIDVSKKRLRKTSVWLIICWSPFLYTVTNVYKELLGFLSPGLSPGCNCRWKRHIRTKEINKEQPQTGVATLSPTCDWREMPILKATRLCFRCTHRIQCAVGCTVCSTATTFSLADENTCAAWEGDEIVEDYPKDNLGILGNSISSGSLSMSVRNFFNNRVNLRTFACT